MKDLSTYIKGIDEGIDFDPETKTVSFNLSSEENVDTSIENNPSVDNELINNVEVWSIFKRKHGMRGDGNPLVYALKNENGWKFKTNNDKINIEKQINFIIDKFIKLNPINITLILPSTNNLNNYIGDLLKSKVKNINIISGAICKLTTEEVDDIVLDFNSSFRQHYKKSFNAAYKKLCMFLNKMDDEKNGTFTRHFIKDKEMRDVINTTLKVSTDKLAEFSNLINTC